MSEKEYPLTFLQAIEKILEGKTVSNNDFNWHVFFKNTEGNIIELDNAYGTGSITMYLNKEKIEAKWRVEE